ncbi:hypothetical protein BGW42_003851 [Actinomortierella wolfii]|nr:hypothetical protein BGW42_003851 [Actinomortierella wolfii]
MHRIYNVRLSKAAVSTPQALDQAQAAEPSSGTVPHQQAQEQSGDILATTGSNENHEQILHKARRGVILRALAFGIIPGGVLFGLHGFLYAYYHGAGGITNCNEINSDTDSFFCRFLSIKIVLGLIPVVWLFVDVYIRSKLEWRRWKKRYSCNGEIEMGYV